MANYELRFLCLSDDDTYLSVKTVKNDMRYNLDFIAIDYKDYNGVVHQTHLDKSTAIKFAKTLRTEINKIEL
tara:strand:- start:1571 stop:1786 length:216 start_codon:yes stop_codon:yes gene_type:complete